MVKDAIKKTRGAAGPSGMDADGWCHNWFKVTLDMQEKTFENQCPERNANYLATFLTCKLIPLDKQPGVRPVGIGEVLRWLIGKRVMRPLRKDVLKETGPLQLCTGQDAEYEAAIHVAFDMFSEDTEVVLTVDALNAFNSINREAFLHNTKLLCPA